MLFIGFSYNSMNQEKKKIEKQEKLAQDLEEDCEGEEEMDEQSGQSSFEDELVPRPVFQIDQNNQNLTEEEKEAFSYILSVRNQKQEILSNHKKNARKHKPANYHEADSHEGLNFNCMNNDGKDFIWQQLAEWRSEAVCNWRCVVANMKYLHKNKKSEEMIKVKLGLQCLDSVPQVYQICSNKWLTLPQIQSLLIYFSNQRYEMLQKMTQQKNEDDVRGNYHEWMYSLLALHQSYAAYTNFQALASVNACVQREWAFYWQRMEAERQKSKQNIGRWLLTATILIEGFNQLFLKKNLGIIKMFF